MYGLPSAGGRSPAMSITPFLTFPRAGIPSPEEREMLRTEANPLLKSLPPKQTQPILWFCCVCATAGREDIIGQEYDDYHTKCEICKHAQCRSCGLAWARRKEYIIHTKGGLYASPNYVDPFHWECPCGEWRLNRLDEDTVLGETRCANPYCQGREAGWPPVGLDTIVMNKYGQRLGVLDQSVMQAGGPWAAQRRALGDPTAALAAGLRPKPFRTVTAARVPELWGEGEPAPHYPLRPPGRSWPRLDPKELSYNHQAYMMGYLRSLPFAPRNAGGEQALGNAAEEREPGGKGTDERGLLLTPPATSAGGAESE